MGKQPLSTITRLTVSKFNLLFKVFNGFFRVFDIKNWWKTFISICTQCTHIQNTPLQLLKPVINTKCVLDYLLGSNWEFSMPYLLDKDIETGSMRYEICTCFVQIAEYLYRMKFQNCSLYVYWECDRQDCPLHVTKVYGRVKIYLHSLLTSAISTRVGILILATPR